VKEAPAFQLYAADFYMDTLTWDTDDIGVYFCLLMAEWVNGPLDNDTRKLAKIAKKTHQKFIKNWSKISHKFSKLDTGKLANLRLEEEREKQHKYSESRRKAADTRWNKEHAYASAHASGMHIHKTCPSSSSSLESKILEDSLPSTINPTFVERGVSAKTETPSVAPKKDKPKRASQMPADFSLTPQMEAYARAKGLDGDIAMVWERFVLHHQSKGTTMMDWNKAWMKWVLNEIKFAGRANGGYPAKQLANDARERKPLTKEQIEELVS